MKTFAYRFHKYGGFSNVETIQILLTGVLAGFFLSFDNWGIDTPDVSIGMQNFLSAVFAVFLIMASYVLAQKALGIFFGYQVHYEYSWIGLLIGAFITFLSAGAVPFFLPGGVQYKLISHARLGKFLPDYKYSEMFLISSLAVIVPLIFTVPFGALYLSTGNDIFRHITVAALFIAVYALVPTPHVEGLRKWGTHGLTDVKPIKHLNGGTYGYDLFNFNHTAYVVLAIAALVFTALVSLFQVFSFVLSLILTLVIIFVYKIMIGYFSK